MSRHTYKLETRLTLLCLSAINVAFVAFVSILPKYFHDNLIVPAILIAASVIIMNIMFFVSRRSTKDYVLEVNETMIAEKGLRSDLNWSRHWTDCVRAWHTNLDMGDSNVKWPRVLTLVFSDRVIVIKEHISDFASVEEIVRKTVHPGNGIEEISDSEHNCRLLDLKEKDMFISRR